jgi:endonuclease/exonuclease/phosphatase family metal-dependent hydrolase
MADANRAATKDAKDGTDLRVVTYNIHRCRGLDRRVRPERIAAVLATIDPDVVALQEAIGPGLSGPGHAEQLGAALSHRAASSPRLAPDPQRSPQLRQARPAASVCRLPARRRW